MAPDGIIERYEKGRNRPLMLHKVLLLLNRFIEFITILYQRRSLIYTMAKHDIATNHTGTMLGFFWTFINPLIMIFILWFVFSFGLKVAPKGGVPFAVWLTAGIAIWNTFSEIVNGPQALLSIMRIW